MKILSLFLTVLFLLGTGCAVTPEVLNKEVSPTLVEKAAPDGCTQSKIANPRDLYSYQGSIDPQVIQTTWTLVRKLSKGSSIMAELAFRNLDKKSNITVALMMVIHGSTVAYCYLEDGDPKVFQYNPKTACYELNHELGTAQRNEFRKALHRILLVMGFKEA